MIQIRKGIFETNSSSSHSIVITKNDKPADGMIDGDWHVGNDGFIDFWYNEDLDFGRTPFDLLSDWWGRLRYCIASYAGDKEKIKEIEEICQRRISGFVGFKFAKDRFDNSDYQGYVDHQSSGLLQAALKKYNIPLEDFIFNDRYIVVIDGDEYCVFDTLVESDIFNKANVDDIISAESAFEWSKQ